MEVLVKIDASTLISVAALVASIAIPLFLDHRQAPRVRVRVGRTVTLSGDQERRFYSVSAVNRGRTAVFINKVNLSSAASSFRGDVILGLPSQPDKGPDLPHELKPFSDASFGMLEGEVNKLFDPGSGQRLYGSVDLSNGYRVRSRKGFRVRDPRALGSEVKRIARLLIFTKERWF